MLQGKVRFAVDNVFLHDMDAFFRIDLGDGFIEDAL